MSSQAFFWANAGIALLVILIFLIGKKGIVAPSKLNLKKGYQKPGVVPKGSRYASAATFNSHSGDREKSLNILFMYNGHTFDAYEVLGVPAGASFEMVQKFYNEAVSRNGQDKEFLEAAYFAIKSTLPN